MCISPNFDLPISSSNEEDSFVDPKSLPRLVERLPKAVRDHDARVFEGCLREVVTVGRLSSWSRLMDFPSSFILPPRTVTGRRHRLATQLSAQLHFFSKKSKF